MKKLLLLIALLVTVVITSGSVLMKTMGTTPIQISSKALSDDGLTLISPLDISFDQELSKLIMGGQSSFIAAIEANKPICVFLKNTGPHDVVAYSLKWEFLNANGTVTSRSISYGSPGALSSSNPAGSGSLVRANTSRFVSLDANLDGFVQAAINNSGRPGMDALYRALEGYLVSSKEYRGTLPGNVTAVTVSLDGAFFDDGTFVGPNTTNLFEKIQAEISAQKDVAGVVDEGQKEGKGPEEISRLIEEIAREPRLRKFDDPDLNAHYNHFAKVFAGELRNVNETKGGIKMLKHVKRLLDAEYPVLRKKDKKV